MDCDYCEDRAVAHLMAGWRSSYVCEEHLADARRHIEIDAVAEIDFCA